MKSYSCVVFAIFLLLLCGCGGGSSSTSGTVAVTVSPTSGTIATGTSMQFTNTVQNTSNTSVIWRVNGVAGGSAAFGTISGSGLYTAPSVVPTVPNITVTAVAAADSSKSADASVTIALPISVSPSSVSVVAAQNVQFTASVTFSTNTGVNWLVNGVTGGNSSTGTIDSNGLYTAPNSVPAPNKVTVTAVSKADGSRNALATVTITPAAIVISPTDALLSAGAQQAYTATVLSSAVKPVWKVMCASTQPGDCGSITSDGTYTAPPGPPLHGVVTIEANLSDGSGSNGNVTATIQFGNATLAGRYVFSTADEVGHAVPSQTGTIVFDGSGNISGGLFDTADKPGAPTSVTGGTYQVGSDGRGTAAVQTTSGPFNLQFALSSHTKGFVVRTDSTANQAAGTLELQQIIPGTSALNGAHVLSVSGFTTSASAVRFAEAGSILTSNTGAITGGSIDLNKNLTLQANSVSAGSFTQPSIDGRGTLTFSSASSTQTFAYYLIDNAHARIVAVDGSDAVGELFRQAQGSVSSLSLRGRYAFLVNGTMNGDPFGVAGVFALDGSTSVTDQLFDGLAQTVFDFNPGSYSVTDPTTGRTTATWTANSGTKIQYVMYPRSDGGLAMLESDGLYQASGVALPQTSSVGNFLVTQGGFALHLRGSSFATPLIAERYTGQIRYSSSSALVATVDGASVSQGSAFTLNLTNLNTTRQRYVFGTASDVATLAGKVTIMYRINDDEVFAIESNENRTLTGILQRQF